MAHTIATLIALVNELTDLMNKYGHYYLPSNEIPIGQLYLAHTPSKGHTMFFDTMTIHKDGSVALMDYEHHQMRLAELYGYDYFGTTAKKFWEDEIYTEHIEGRGMPLDKLPQEVLDTLIAEIERRIAEDKATLPSLYAEEQARIKEATERQERYDKAFKALPFLEQYFLKQFGEKEYEKAFHKKFVY